ncbi:hypothetical protein LXL04_027212 [Taraxacum kok-saghyz]
MIMANTSSSYECQFYDDYDYGFAFPANEPPADLVALFNMIGEKSRGDHSEVDFHHVCFDVYVSICMFPHENFGIFGNISESQTICGITNGLNDPASRPIPFSDSPSHGSLAIPPIHYSEPSISRPFYSSDSSFTEIQTFNSGYEKLQFHQDGIAADANPWSTTQDFLPYGKHAMKETYMERLNISNDTLKMDSYGLTDGIFDKSVGNSYQISEPYDNMEAQFMDLSMYSEILCSPSEKLYAPFITSLNKPIYFGLNDIDDTFFDNKTESESTSGFHGVHMANKTQVDCVKNEKHDGKSLVPKKKSSLVNIRKNGKLKNNDEKSAHQAPLQMIPHEKSDISVQDGGLTVPLLKHQRIALSWMTRKETRCTRCCGGILADDQGLGKTISAIALILKERSPASSTENCTKTNQKQTETLNLDEEEDVTSDTKDRKSSLAAGTLVVCPTSVLRQWNQELQNKVTTESNLSVLVYYGRFRTKDPIEVAKYDVVLTTYAIVAMEVPKQPLVEQEDEDDGKTKQSPNKKRKIINESSNSESINRPLAKLRWFRVILDEAQIMKNYKTQVARACWGLRAKRRWCLSGTPVQNSIDDLYSYFRFLRYDPFSVFKSFCSQIKAPIQRNPVSGYKKLQFILKTIMLRRTKSTLVKGKPIISLPPKTITLKKVEFIDEERRFYRSLEAESCAQFAKYAAAGTVNQNYVNILLMLLRLRQACDHPLLVKQFSTSNGRMLSFENSKELPSEKLTCLDNSLAICGICNDPPEDAVVTSCEHVFCKQCILEHLSSDDNQCPFPDCKKLVDRSTVFCKSTLGVVNKSTIEPSKALGSSKIKAALHFLQSISVNEKAIVFSQWTRMLDLLEVCLEDSSIGYRRLDGTMSVHARDKAVTEFNTLPDVSVMIMSLKAASLGLNMVAACHVILLDLWWNPTTEDQAIDRAHRIGQTRPVTVLRLTVKDTVEDRILALQEKKREMVAAAFGDDDNGGSQTRLTVEDMRYLFQG